MLEDLVVHSGIADRSYANMARYNENELRRPGVQALTDAELIRRASKIVPPLSYDALKRRVRNCGTKTATELSKALGLPHPPYGKRMQQCPRCGHVFGGSKK
jgi:hypothetical protein